MSIENLRTELQNAYQNSFMKPEFFNSDYVEIDGDNGVVFVPADEMFLSLSSDTCSEVEYEDLEIDDMETVAQAYQNIFGGNAEPYTVAIKNGYIYRLSASGYMDSTDYTAAETEEDAIKSLLELAD